MAGLDLIKKCQIFNRCNNFKARCYSQLIPECQVVWIRNMSIQCFIYPDFVVPQKIPPAAILDQNMYLVISKSLIHQMMLNSVKIVHVLHPCIIAFLETYHLATKDRKVLS